MLPDRILTTLRFFDLQDMALTVFEIHKFLLPEPVQLRENLNEQYEVSVLAEEVSPESLSDVSLRLQQLVETSQAEEVFGYYVLPGRRDLVEKRLKSYRFGIHRERLIQRFFSPVRHLPFIRAVALGGSQALGLAKENSDIDLFIITDPNFLWLARTFITAYFQIMGHRRHGQKIANRFCLNHYVAGTTLLNSDRDLYNAMEYLRFRPLVGEASIANFKNSNLSWIKMLYGNAMLEDLDKERPSWLQKALESLFSNRFGQFIENLLGSWQSRRIMRGDYVIATETELSFHSKERKRQLFIAFFEDKKQNQRVTI